MSVSLTQVMLRNTNLSGAIPQVMGQLSLLSTVDLVGTHMRAPGAATGAPQLPCFLSLSELFESPPITPTDAVGMM